jgi:hypothetical protein
MAIENEENVVADEPVDLSADTPVVETPAETPEGPTSVAEAINAGLEQVPARTKEEVDKAASKVKGEESSDPAKDEKKDDAKGEAKAGEEKPDEKDEKKELDHINDPIPKELGERAQERIRSLVGYIKERDEALTVQGNLISAIQNTGTSAEEFATTVQFLEAFHSEDPKMLEKALGILQQNMENIALRLGRDVPGVDFLQGFDDLKSKVHYGQLTKEDAQEIARSRTRASREQTLNTQRTTAQQTETAAKAEKDTAISALNDIGQQLLKSDPDYQRKFDLLVHPLQAAFKRLPPSQWKDAFNEAYAAIKLPPAAPAAPAAPPAGMVRDPTTGQFVKPAKGVPIRPVQPAGAGGKSAPKSAREAMDAAIDNLR